MSWGMVAVGVGTAAAGYMSSKASSKAASQSADASVQAANVQAEAQREALAYLKETEEIPQQFREEALTKLGGIFGLDSGEGSQAEFINSLKNTPLYKSIVNTKREGEEAILRNASATGGLRSGSVQENLYDYNTQLEVDALLQSYNQEISGLQGLANLSTDSSSIADLISSIGTTQAQGITAAAQALQTGTQNQINNLMGIGQLGLSAYSAFSDIRLKTNIVPLGMFRDIPIYAWKWNKTANAMGLEGFAVGAIADELKNSHPEMVKEFKGYLTVDYSQFV